MTEGADPGWEAAHEELLTLHVRKSATYGRDEERFANFVAVAGVTGQVPERYVLERILEKTVRALNMIEDGDADLVREYPDLSSLGLICEAFKRRRTDPTSAEVDALVEQLHGQP